MWQVAERQLTLRCACVFVRVLPVGLKILDLNLVTLRFSAFSAPVEFRSSSWSNVSQRIHGSSTSLKQFVRRTLATLC